MAILGGIVKIENSMYSVFGKGAKEKIPWLIQYLKDNILLRSGISS
jgi:hypothetical protein